MSDMSLAQQYRQLHDEAAVLELADRGTIIVSGGDRASYLQGLLTNDIEALTPGTGCYAAYLTPQGRMIADMTVLEFGDRMLLDVDRAQAETLVQRLSMLVFSEDVRVADESAAWWRFGVRGPGSAARLATVLTGGPDGEAGSLEAYADHDCSRREPVLVARNDELGVPGFDLWIAEAQREMLRARLAEAQLVSVPPAAAELLRVEAGTPRFGIDMDEQTIPLEAGIEARAISETKGCYVGQEVIIRVLHRGQGRVARKLVGLIFGPEADVASLGDRVYDGAEQVGRVTSAVRSPKLARPIALAYVQRARTAAGTEVQVDVSGEKCAAQVSSLPF